MPTQPQYIARDESELGITPVGTPLGFANTIQAQTVLIDIALALHARDCTLWRAVGQYRGNDGVLIDFDVACAVVSATGTAGSSAMGTGR